MNFDFGCKPLSGMASVTFVPLRSGSHASRDHFTFISECKPEAGGILALDDDDPIGMDPADAGPTCIDAFRRFVEGARPVGGSVAILEAHIKLLHLGGDFFCDSPYRTLHILPLS